MLQGYPFICFHLWRKLAVHITYHFAFVLCPSSCQNFEFLHASARNLHFPCLGTHHFSLPSQMLYAEKIVVWDNHFPAQKRIRNWGWGKSRLKSKLLTARFTKPPACLPLAITVSREHSCQQLHSQPMDIFSVPQELYQSKLWNDQEP